MFLSSYITKYLRDDSALMTLMNNKVYHRHVPQKSISAPYIVVLTADQYDPGNISVGSLTWKQEGFTILCVGVDFDSLQGPFLKLDELITACRDITVTSTGLAASMYIQCLLMQDPRVIEGIIIDGTELANPCLVIPVLGSNCLPVPT